MSLHLAPTTAHLSTALSEPRGEHAAPDDPGLRRGALLAARLAPPALSAGVIARPQLLARLDAVWQRPLTLVAAPAGFGKTTLLASWLSELRNGALSLDQPAPLRAAHFCWLSLEQGDNDPAQFWRAVIAALRTQHLTSGTDALALLNVPQPQAELVVTALLNDLAALTGDTVLILDDYHLIEAPLLHQTLLALVEHAPPQLRLIVASRSDPPLALARLRAYGHLQELRAPDLRFSPDEAARFLNDALGLDLPAADVRVLVERTEGWVVGLRLAALSLSGHADRTAFIAQFAGTDRYIVDYLVEEVLLHQPAELQAFLLQTSILTGLNESLCDAVAGRATSSALLTRIERANLFVLALDSTRQWFRYYQPFADVLRHQLEQSQPALLPTLHRRAAGWYAAHAMPAEAVEHALALGDLEWAADLIEQATKALAQRGDPATAERWLAALPAATVRARPCLALLSAFTLSARGQFQAAESWLDIAAARVAEIATPDDEIADVLTAVRLFIVRLRGDTPRSVVLTQQALVHIPPSNKTLRALVMLNLGDIYQITGDLAAAARTLVEGIALAQGADDSLLTTLRQSLEQPPSALRPDWAPRYAHAFGLLATRVEAMRSVKALLVAAMGYVALAEILYEWNALELAEAHIHHGLALAQHAGHSHTEAYGRAAVLLSRIRAALDNWDAGLALLDEAEQHEVCATPLRHGVTLQRARLWLARGDIERAAQWVHERWPRVEAELSEAQLLEHTMLARVLIAQGDGDGALRVLSPLRAAAEQASRSGHLVEIGALEALAHQARGDSQQALAALDHVVSLAEPGGYLRSFLDAGAPMANLLRRSTARGAARAATRAYAEWLLAFWGRTASEGDGAVLDQRLLLAEPLSARELTVLELLLTGASNQEIARRLVITTGTVKRHVHSIYGKLNAHNRVELMARARELHLLSN